MTTPHLAAPDGAYAPIVLMPGDPLRARYIAHNFLDTDKPITAVRAMEGYTGTWKGVPVSVQGSGMGIPSFQIYATELIRFYGIETIVRVGSCGALQDDVALGDIIVATGAGTDSNTNRARLNGWDLPAVADWDLLRRFGDLTRLFSLPAYVGGSIEAGNVWFERSDMSLDSMIVAGSAFVGVDTPLGPLFLGYGRAEQGVDSFYLSFEKLLRPFGRRR